MSEASFRCADAGPPAGVYGVALAIHPEYIGGPSGPRVTGVDAAGGATQQNLMIRQR